MVNLGKLPESVMKKWLDHTDIIPRTTASGEIIENEVIEEIWYAIESLLLPPDLRCLHFNINSVN